MEEEKFEFTLPDGSKHLMTVHQARGFGCKYMNQRADEIVDHIKSKNKPKRKKDGFTPGWQENIRMHITCPHQYRRALKELGLVEIGNDYIPQETTKTSNPFANENLIKEAVKSGIYLSGNEIEALKSGEYFKDVKPVDAD